MFHIGLGRPIFSLFFTQHNGHNVIGIFWLHRLCRFALHVFPHVCVTICRNFCDISFSGLLEFASKLLRYVNTEFRCRRALPHVLLDTHSSPIWFLLCSIIFSRIWGKIFVLNSTQQRSFSIVWLAYKESSVISSLSDCWSDGSDRCQLPFYKSIWLHSRLFTAGAREIEKELVVQSVTLSLMELAPQN